MDQDMKILRKQLEKQTKKLCELEATKGNELDTPLPEKLTKKIKVGPLRHLFNFMRLKACNQTCILVVIGKSLVRSWYLCKNSVNWHMFGL